MPARTWVHAAYLVGCGRQHGEHPTADGTRAPAHEDRVVDLGFGHAAAVRSGSDEGGIALADPTGDGTAAVSSASSRAMNRVPVVTATCRSR